MGEFTDRSSAFNPDESIALVRYFRRLLDARDGDTLVETITAIAAASLSRHRADLPLACAKGCDPCCYQPVSVTAIEAFAIARKLRRAKDLADHRARLAARPIWGPHDPARIFDRAKPCAFLVAGACSIHAIRPLPCRVMVSGDRAACVRRLDNGNGTIPFPRSHEPIRTWLSTALLTAHVVTNLEPRSYELTGAVAAILEDPGIEARWYAGDDGLVAAADPPLPPNLPDVLHLRALARI